MSDAFAIRLAGPDDASALAILEAEARAALADLRGGAEVLAEQPAVGDWSGVLSAPDRHAWVAEIDGTPVGYLELSLAADGAGVVRQVYVEPGAREVGFGDDLLAAAVDAVRTAGGARIESFALPGDRQTKNLFERAGLTARKLIVAKQLSDPSSSADASR